VRGDHWSPMPVAAVASWRAEPSVISGEWTCFRQVSPRWPPLYHNAGVPAPDQESGRWHRKGESYAQYLALSGLGAWAECARYYSVRSVGQARNMKRNLWLVFVREARIADLSTFDHYEACGLDAAIAVGDHTASQALADELRGAGFRGMLSPSAALPGVVNLTLFGERYEKVLLTDVAAWANPDVDAWLPCQPLAMEAAVPVALCTETVFKTKKHETYRAWMKAKGRGLGPSAP
jgi:RES domain-containing protein